MRHVVVMCRSSECDLYCVSTQIRMMSPLTKFDSTKSTSRYIPPKGTAGLARSAVSGISRLPSPPASTIPRIEGPPRIRRPFCRSAAPAATAAAGRSSLPQDLLVHRHRPAGDRVPAELPHRALAPGPAHPPRGGRVGQYVVDCLGQAAFKRGGVRFVVA